MCFQVFIHLKTGADGVDMVQMILSTFGNSSQLKYQQTAYFCVCSFLIAQHTNVLQHFPVRKSTFYFMQQSPSQYLSHFARFVQWSMFPVFKQFYDIVVVQKKSHMRTNLKIIPLQPGGALSQRTKLTCAITSTEFYTNRRTTIEIYLHWMIV